jgi:hypothetical protein
MQQQMKPHCTTEGLMRTSLCHFNVSIDFLYVKNADKLAHRELSALDCVYGSIPSSWKMPVKDEINVQ